MSTNRTRKRRAHTPDIDPALYAWLAGGPMPVDGYFLTDDEVRTLWNAHKAVILATWIETSPRTRPPMWWQFDAPTRRRVLPSGRLESEGAYLRRVVPESTSPRKRKTA